MNVPSNKYAEMNMFLDPLAAKTVLESKLNITFIPLSVQRKVSSFPEIIKRLRLEKKTPEAVFVRNLISRLHSLQKKHRRYKHMDMFLGEILGTVTLSDDIFTINSSLRTKCVKIYASGDESEDGQIIIDQRKGKMVKILEHVDSSTYYDKFAHQLGVEKQSAVIESFDEQRQIWSTQKSRKD
jgi:inosine-uridine nucleoside N-ribohydrolase